MTDGIPVDIDSAIERAVRRLRFELAEAIAGRDVERFVGTFAPDGVWLVGGHKFAGRDQIRSFVAASWATLSWQSVHFGQDAILSATASEVRSRAHFVEHLVGSDSATYVVGCYDETCVRLQEGWRYAERVADVVYAGPPNLMAPPPRR